MRMVEEGIHLKNPEFVDRLLHLMLSICFTEYRSMEAIENHCNTGQKLSDTEELQTYIPPMAHV